MAPDSQSRERRPHTNAAAASIAELRSPSDRLIFELLLVILNFVKANFSVECMGDGLTPDAPQARSKTNRDEPGERLRLFHDLLAEGRTEDVEELFSFSSAYEYWRDIAVSAGLRVPEEGKFQAMVKALFSSSLVRDLVAGSEIRPAKVRVMGPVASVVFERSLSTGARGVATLVNEGGSWKVRTYPGIFPGELLSLIGAARRPQHERLV